MGGARIASCGDQELAPRSGGIARGRPGYRGFGSGPAVTAPRTSYGPVWVRDHQHRGDLLQPGNDQRLA
jgi:hypothetical protein